jgi:threonine dehydrogenase-like Zn-dependent dehydrogenase
VLPEWAVLPLSDDFTDEEGALLACNVSTAYSALMKGPAAALTRLVVFGQGGVGLSAVLLGRALGARVAAVDLVDERLHMASEFGAELTLNPSRDDVAREILLWSGGCGVELIVECSGATAAIQQALAVAGPHGKLIFVGAGGRLDIPVAGLLGRELSLHGSSVYQPHEMEALMRLIREKQIPIRRLIGQTFRIDQAEEAFAAAAARNGGKILFDWR